VEFTEAKALRASATFGFRYVRNACVRNRVAERRSRFVLIGQSNSLRVKSGSDPRSAASFFRFSGSNPPPGCQWRMNLNFIATINDGTLLITVGSMRLDAAVAGEFKARVESVWAAGVNRVEVDLGAVEFIDSSGVGALISLFRKSLGVPGGLRLTQVRPGVWAVLELLHLETLFTSVSACEPSPVGRDGR
jgi:anti-sigma B factor antagonist